jgi:hypothetical protein
LSSTPEIAVTEADAFELAEKLSRFGATLTDGEQALLWRVLQSSKPGTEVEGYALNAYRPFAAGDHAIIAVLIGLLVPAVQVQQIHFSPVVMP